MLERTSGCDFLTLACSLTKSGSPGSPVNMYMRGLPSTPRRSADGEPGVLQIYPVPWVCAFLPLLTSGGVGGRKGRVGLGVLPKTRCPGIPEPPQIFTASSLECPQNSSPHHPGLESSLRSHQQFLHRILHQLLPILVLFTQERPQLLALPASPPTQSRGLLFLFFLPSLHKEHWI